MEIVYIVEKSPYCNMEAKPFLQPGDPCPNLKVSIILQFFTNK